MNYLNIFEHYKHDAYSIPLENNLTRVFARILNDNYFVAINFFNLLATKCKEKGYKKIDFSYIDSDYIVDIQKDIGELSSILDDDEKKERVIGVALTAKNIDWNNDNSIDEASDNQRPDIFFNFNNYNFIIEAKKTNEDCSNQLKKYIKTLGNDNLKMISVTWNDVIEILEKAVQSNHSDLIVQEYLEYVKSHFPMLFSYRSLKYSIDEEGRVKENNKILVENRIELALSNIKSIDNDKCFNDLKDKSLYLKGKNFQQRISIGIDNEYIWFGTWLGDTR